jgi:hypothetical protein
MSRGRDTNVAYVALDQPDDSHSTPEADDVGARTVLLGVLHRSGAGLSAHQTMEATDEQHASVAASTAFGPLAAAIRRAEAYHHDLAKLLPRVVSQHGLDDADDIAAVLR